MRSNLGVALLWAAVFFSALVLVWTTQQSREQLHHYLTLRTEENQLLVRHGQYLLQERSLASAAVLEMKAKERLALAFPGDDQIRVLD